MCVFWFLLSCMPMCSLSLDIFSWNSFNTDAQLVRIHCKENKWSSYCIFFSSNKCDTVLTCVKASSFDIGHLKWSKTRLSAPKFNWHHPNPIFSEYATVSNRLSCSILDLNDTHINVGLISILLHLKRHFSAWEACPSINGAKEEEEKRWAKGMGVFLSWCLCFTPSISCDIFFCDKSHL